MKKEKWMLGEIDLWEKEKIIDSETSLILKSRYEPKKKINLLIVLFSIIGTLFVGAGIVLVGAHNLWYKLPVAVRTVIGLLPLIVSQIFVLYVFLKKYNSVALRESAAILNFAGVFSSLAIVGQIFHLPSDFTNYILVCGVLSLPSMVILNAVSPLPIYFWTVINGGLGLTGILSTPVALFLYGIGVAYAIFNFKEDNARSVYIAWIVSVAGFILFWIGALLEDFDPFVSVFAYFVLLLSASTIWKNCGKVFEWSGIAGTLIPLLFASYEGFWHYLPDSDITLVVISAIFVVMSVMIQIWKRRFNFYVIAGYIMIIMRVVWALAKLNTELYQIAFSIITNIILLAIGVYLIWSGAKRVSLLETNTGMLTVCLLIVLRFFDTEMSLGIRGIIFILLGAGFLFVNSRLVRMKKMAKEEK